MIRNYKRENIGSCKYTFRLGAIFKQRSGMVIDVVKGKYPQLEQLALPYTLKPGEFVLGKTIEEFDTPLDLMSLYGATSLSMRIGLQILFGGVNDPGYQGCAIFGIHNISQNKIVLRKEMELLHTTFLSLEGRAVAVQTKYMGGKIL